MQLPHDCYRGKNSFCPVIEFNNKVPIANIVIYSERKGKSQEKVVLLQNELSNSKNKRTMKEIYLAGGCFWGTEHYFKLIQGVTNTEVGFANGDTENPTYKEVYTDQTGYAETVHVVYDEKVVSLEFLLNMFFKAIDPTSLNRQGHDEGTRYRTGVYYVSEDQLPVINKVFAEQQALLAAPIAVERLPLKNFYTAEEYHQNYLDKNPDGYCHLPTALFEYARQARPSHSV